MEQRLRSARQHAVDDLVEAPLAAIVHGTEAGGHLLDGAVRGVQRRERGLVRAAGGHFLQVGEEDVLGLRGEVEDHVDVERVEARSSLADALKDLRAAAVLSVAVHLLEQSVVEALHAHGQALYAPLHLLEVGLGQVVGVRLDRHLPDVEMLACRVKRFAQFVDHDGGRAAAHVDALEVVTQLLEHEHFLAQTGEVGLRHLLAEGVAVEAAVRAQHLAEGHMQVEHVRAAVLGGRHEPLVGGLEVELALGDAFDDRREHAFRNHPLSLASQSSR